jgi:hypothetical protein
MKTMLVAFCLVAAARLSAQDGLPFQTIPPKTDRPISYSYSEGFVMGVLVNEAKPSKEDVDFFSKLVSAIAKKDFQSFVADGEPAFKTLPEEEFTSFASQLAPKLNGDRDVTFLGALRQKGYRVTLWKVSFKDGNDDMLATLSVRNGKIGGFYIK